MIFENRFDNLSKEQVTMLDEYFDSYDYDLAGYTLPANYMWRNTHSMTWNIIDGYLIISSICDEETDDETPATACISMPLTNTGSYDILNLRKVIMTVKEMFDDRGLNMVMGFIPESLLAIFEEAVGDIFEFSYDRDDDEYVYLREDLATLKGRKLHNKKNHLNHFLKNYEYTYEGITKENLAEVEAFIHAKNDYILQDTPEDYMDILERENEAIVELLKLLDTGRLLTGVIRVEGNIVAVTIGEYANTKKHDNVIVHVEKADDRLRGLYQAINWEFVRNLPEDVIYVNREEDMGMPSLRQAKEGYKPHHMSKKYVAMAKNTNSLPMEYT